MQKTVFLRHISKIDLISYLDTIMLFPDAVKWPHVFSPKTKKSKDITFRSYFLWMERRGLNTFRMTTIYVSTSFTVSLYMARY